MPGRPGPWKLDRVPHFILHHQHSAGDCAVAFAAWSGFHSPLRGGTAVTSCLTGGHSVWWRVEARDPRAALALLPPYVSRRSKAIPVRDVQIP